MDVTSLVQVGERLARRAQRHHLIAESARACPVRSRIGWAVATLFVILGTLDVLSTEWALAVGGQEANELMVSLQTSLGDYWYIPKMMVQASVGAMIVWSPNRATIAIMTLVCGWTSSVVSNNFLIAISLS